MERTKYTDDVLDTRMKAIDNEFSRVSGELHELRREMRAGFSELRGEIAGVRDDLRGEIAGVRDDLRGEISGVRGEIAGVRTELASFSHQMFWLVGFLAISLVSLLGVAVLQL
jgi:phage-related protein